MQSYKLRIFSVLTAFALLLSTPALADAGSWPGLRGPEFDGAVRTARLFPGSEAGLQVGWRQPLGAGYSAVAVADGRVVTMFTAGEQDVVAAFAVDTGAELWRFPIGEAYAGHDGSHDGPISTPVISEGRVFGLSARGLLFAVDAATGAKAWSKDLVEEMGAKAPFYGFATSPIVVDGVLVVEIGAPEGKAVAGFDTKTGDVLWTAVDDSIDYQSPVAALIGGRMHVVTAGGTKLSGLDPKSGELLWSFEHEGTGGGMGRPSFIPVPADEGRFLLMNKSDASTFVQVKRGVEVDWEVTPLWSTGSLKQSYVTPVYRDGYFYGMNNRIFSCVSAETGEVVWRSREPGDGFPTLVGDKLVIITKPGALHVVEASPDGYHELAKLDLFEEHSWSQVAYAGGHLFARSMAHLARVDVGSSSTTPAEAPTWVAQTDFGHFLQKVAAASDRQAMVDEYLAAQGSFPIIEGPDIVHFLWKGEAQDVGFIGDLIGFRREDPMTRVEGTDLFHYSAILEPDSALMYGFIPDYGERVTDPRNPRSGEGLFGEVSWMSMPAWREPAYLAEAKKPRRGRLEEFTWESAVSRPPQPPPAEGEEAPEDPGPLSRTAQVYLPAGYDRETDRRYPVAYIHGGEDALEAGSMKNALDNLVGDSVEPLIAVFVMPVEENPREIASADSYHKLLLEELIPAIDAKYRTRADRRARASIGVGTAGATALYGALRHADVFGRVASTAPVWFIDSEKPVQELIPEVDAQPMVIYMAWGSYGLRSPHENWDGVVDNREIFAQLRSAGYRPAGGERPVGFGWPIWRAQTADVLSSLFPLAHAGTSSVAAAR